MKSSTVALVFVLSLLGACNDKTGGGNAVALDVVSSEIATTDGAPIADAPAPDSATTTVADLDVALDRLNAQRISSGLEVLVLDPALSEGCAAHVAYMIAEGKLLREEAPSHAAYSVAGAQAGKNGLLAAGMMRASGAATAWIDGLYHRLAVLDPGVSRVGLAFADGYACLDVFSAWVDLEDYPPVLWPGRDQIDVPIAYDPPLGLAPIPFDLAPPTGAVVSLTLAPIHQMSAELTATLTAVGGGAPVETVLRLPLAPDDPYATLHRNTAALIPIAPLAPSTTYDVVVEGVIDAVYTTRAWSFTTRATPP